jgi:hypothetical protein
MHRLCRKLHNFESDGLRAALNRVSPADAQRFLATMVYLRLWLAHGLLQRDDAEGFRQLVSDLKTQRGWYSTDWDVASTPQFVGRLIALCLVDEENRGALIDLAARMFATFREHSQERIPEAFPLVVEMAKQGRGDTIAVKMYREYLACSGRSRKSQDHRFVQRALASCQGAEPTAPP